MFAEPTLAIHFVHPKCHDVHGCCACEKIKANNMADIEEEILFLLLVLKRRQRQLQNRRKHWVWIRKMFTKRHDRLNFSPIFSQLLAFLFLSLKFLLLQSRSQTIPEVCFHMIADDRRAFCDLRFAIVYNHIETNLKLIKCHLLNVEYL